MLPAQLTALAADIAASSDLIPFNGVQTAVNAIPHTPQGADAIATAYNLATAYLLWQTSASPIVIKKAVNAANYTPSDAVPGSPSTDLTYSNRAFVAQLKQTNIIWLTQGSDPIDFSKTQVRQNFKDSLTAIPCGASGANVDAGWGGASPGVVRLAMMRVATRAEKLFAAAGTMATGPGNDGVAGNRGLNTNPDAPVFEGIVIYPDILAGWGV